MINGKDLERLRKDSVCCRIETLSVARSRIDSTFQSCGVEHAISLHALHTKLKILALLENRA